MEKIILKSLEDLTITAQTIIEGLSLKSKPKLNCLAFYGEMGSGKTTLIKAICREMGVQDATSSPSFAIINEYTAEENKPIFHFDFYRLKNSAEAFDFGYEEYFYSGQLCLIEWPEKIEQLLPVNYWKINIKVGENNHRIIEIDSIEQ